jgi:hypothetical protein
LEVFSLTASGTAQGKRGLQGRGDQGSCSIGRTGDGAKQFNGDIF